MIYLVFPSINVSYWILSDLTAQIALIYYAILFCACIRLRSQYKKSRTTYLIPGGQWGLRLVAGTGLLTCVIIILIGFIPPTHFNFGSIATYEMILVGGIAVVCALPFWIYRMQNR